MPRALYPGSFDPVTNGHLDIIRRAAALFGNLRVAVFANPDKAGLLAPGERVALLREVLADDPRVTVDLGDGLVVRYAEREGFDVLVRGLRLPSDYEFEYPMALMNRHVSPSGIETVFLPTRAEWSFVSSSLVRDLARHGASLAGLVPPPVERALREKWGGTPRRGAD